MAHKRPILLVFLTSSLLLSAGCGSSVSDSSTSTSTATSSSTPPDSVTPPATPAHTTVTHTPTARPTSSGNQLVFGESCGTVGPETVHDGDLLLTGATVLYGFNADYVLPSDLPAAPQQVTLQNGEAIMLGSRLQSRPVAGSSAFLIGVCNTSKMLSHHITGFGVTLASKSDVVGFIQTMNACAELYSRPTDFSGECASGFSPSFAASVPLEPASMPGDSIMIPSPSTLTIPPGKGMTLSFSMPKPDGNVTVTYKLGLATDGGTVQYVIPPTPAAIFATSGHSWDGRWCNVPYMQSQIPATIPPGTYYVCPN